MNNLTQYASLHADSSFKIALISKPSTNASIRKKSEDCFKVYMTKINSYA